jgi:carboxylesterase type B
MGMLNLRQPLEHSVSSYKEWRFLISNSGRFMNGSNSNLRYMPETLSSLAKKVGRTTVLVQVNCRLTIFGFTAPSDLASEHEPRAPKGSMSHEAPEHFGNFGLVDQRHAFQWLQSHIHDCKGDTPNVTAFGVSDGSGSLHLHILSGKPLFNRAILQSDGAPSVGPLPF